MRYTTAIITTVAALVLAIPAGRAQDPGAEAAAEADVDKAARRDEDRRPFLAHVAPAELEGGAPPYHLSATMLGPWRGEDLLLHARVKGQGEYREEKFLRSPKGRYVAVVPEELVQPPGLEYYISSVEEDGSGDVRFASPDTPHFVLVKPYPALLRYEARLKRHQGRRARVEASFFHYDFGATPRLYNKDKKDEQRIYFGDHYNMAETSFTYRFLQDQIYQITFGYGMVGGVLGTTSPDAEEFDHPDVPDSAKPEEGPYQPGVYYGFGKAYWEIWDAVGVEAKVMMGASHKGFEAGGGILARIGTLDNTRFDVGIEGITTVGYRFITELNLAAHQYFHVSVRNEVTSYPYGEDSATIPTLKLKVLADGLEIAGTIGYAVREDYERGGICFGGGLNLNF